MPAAPAAGAELLSTAVSVPDAVDRSCIDRPLDPGRGVSQRAVTAPGAGWISARLEAAAGDWDLAIFDAASGRRVAGSAFLGASEVAQSFVAGGEQLTVQACRRSGGARSARLTVESRAVSTEKPETLSLVRVSTPNRARKDELSGLGLDLTEHGGDGFVDVVLHGDADARALRDAKFIFTTEIADLAARSVRDRAADRVYARSVRRSPLPSGRDTYRRLADYSEDMKQLAEENPNLVKPITLPFQTLTGRSVEGIEITTDVEARDGKPVFLQLGAHHAREWPSSEHAIEWAYELVNGFKAGDARVRRLVGSVRTIVVPVVNPDGFNTSREAGEDAGAGGGRPGGDDTGFFLTVPYEYHRKNCRMNNDAEDDFESTEDDDPAAGDCMQQPAQGASQFGVDPNRNYGGLWGGPGASPSGPAPFGDFAQDYRGNGPFSEAETQNVRHLVSRRQVTTLITNHTYSNLILRPPGLAALGVSIDEPVYKALGDAMAADNGYASQAGFELYDTTGTTEDWTYSATGGLGFTFEIGPFGFHPTFADTVAEYEGTTEAADESGDGGGNREAYFTAMESTANAARHSVIDGGAPAGAVLRLKKSFKTSTSPVIDSAGEEGDPILFDDTLDTTMRVPGSGRFIWHINPSTRPIVAKDQGRAAAGEPSDPIEFNDQTASQPACPTYFEAGPGSCAAGGFEDVPFEIPANGGGVDNSFATVKLAWDDDAADLDLEVYEADAEGNASDDPVGTSAGSSNPEQTTLGPDPEPGTYLARVINFAGGTTYDLSIEFEGPKPFVAGITESWTLTCEVGGDVRATQQLTIARGERKAVDFGPACPRSASAGGGGGGDRISARRCAATRGGVRARGIGRARLGRTRARQRRILRPARRLGSRRGIDRYCARGGGTFRVGYPTRRLNSTLSGRTRKRVRRRVILALSTSTRFRNRGIRVGSSTRAVRRRLRGERRFRIGKNVWFTARARRSTLVFRTRGREVRELGIGDGRLTTRRRATKRFLRAWDRRGPRSGRGR